MYVKQAQRIMSISAKFGGLAIFWWISLQFRLIFYELQKIVANTVHLTKGESR